MSDDASGDPPDPGSTEMEIGAPGMLWDALKGATGRVVHPITKRFSPPAIDASLAELADDDPTATLLHAMDFVVPGKWDNPRALDTFIAAEVPGADEARRAKISARAIELYAEDGSRYRRALAAYSAVDLVDRTAAGLSLATRIGNRFLIVGALEKLAPKTEIVQAIDAAVKLAAEALAFAALHGLRTATPDGLAELVTDFGGRAHEDRLRLATWVVVDGVLPLGPNFVQRTMDMLRVSGEAGLAKSVVFDRLAGLIPGESGDDKGTFVAKTLGSVQSWVDEFVGAHELDRVDVAGRVRRVIDVTGHGFEVVAAAADAVTSYTRHTGTQTVARAVVRAAM